MQLKHKGKVVLPTLTKPEQRMLEKAHNLLEGLALLPCEQKEQADTAAKLVAEITVALTKQDATGGHAAVEQAAAEEVAAAE